MIRTGKLNQMTAFGLLIQNVRKAKGLSQVVLARRAGMTSVQLCKIEKGHSSLTLATAERLAEALDVTLHELLAPRDIPAAVDNRDEADGRSDKSYSRFLSVRESGCKFDSDEDILAGIIERENRVLALQRILAIPSSTMLPFVHSFHLDIDGARTAARYMRSACFVGAATFSDLAEALEFRNVRFHLASLPEGIQSRSYYDTENHSLSIVLSRTDTPERHVYRIAYELAWAVLFGTSGFKPVRESQLRHRFAREFASEFLMPEESVRFTVSQLGVRLDDWDLSSVVWLKSKFNVSAEAFALRLESLRLISERLRQKIRDELREYYKSHPKAMEPRPALLPLKIGMMQKLLERAAAKRGAGE